MGGKGGVKRCFELLPLYLPFLKSYNYPVPTVLRLKGYRFFFFSNDKNEPVHIHVDSGDDYAKFWLEPVELENSSGYNAKELNEIRRLIADNLTVLRRKWDEYFNG